LFLHLFGIIVFRNYKGFFMKVLLLQNIKNLGKVGEIKDVKDGYGQNFIIKKGLGKLATPSVIKQYQALQKKLKQELEAEILRLKEVAKKIENIKIKVSKKLGANGSLFGALKKEEIVEKLSEQSIEIDKKDIEIEEQIKATGEYDIKIKLGHSINATLKVVVEGE